MNNIKEVGTLTDVCNNSNLPEVEIISLIEEQIPRYKLRADTLTKFQGYENEDWFIPSPALPPDTNVALSVEQAEETLKYFALCSDRVSQMTKAYNDIEAVTRLLEEKEKDLELAAKIGQSLLARNKILQQKNEELEEQLTLANDNVTQLKHELTMKNELLQIYAQDIDYAESDSSADTPVERFSISLLNLETLQKKIRGLEEENLQLRNETCDLKTETISFEEKEAQLIHDCVKQLAEANSRIKVLSEELTKKTEDTIRQQEEITSLLAQVVELQKKLKKLTLDNDDLTSHLQAAKESQQQLAAELVELKDKYGEVMEMLQEAQEESKFFRRKGQPTASKRSINMVSPFLPPDSLASELENSLRKDMSYPLGYSPEERRVYNRKILETAKYASRRPSRFLTTPSSSQSSSGTFSMDGSLGLLSLTAHTDSDSSDGYHGDSDSICSSTPNLGRPGIPGSNDLETAIRRLSLRRAADKEYLDQERQRRRSSIHSDLGSDTSVTPTQCRTPDSIMSTGSGISGLSGLSGMTNFSHGFRSFIPEKLQIIKPMEGSLTLHQWQRLATPHLGGLLDQRPGVQIKGERKLDLQETEEIYNLSDYEEDDLSKLLSSPEITKSEYSMPGKRFMSTSSVYTYTTSTVMHPSDDNTHVTPSFLWSEGISSAKVDERIPYNQNYLASPPVPDKSEPKTPNSNLNLSSSSKVSSSLASPQNTRATSTFSTTIGLAKLLKERGIGAMNCSSPDCSTPSSPVRNSGTSLSTATETLLSLSNSRPIMSLGGSITTRITPSVDSAVNSGINLISKLKDIGLENIITTMAEENSQSATVSNQTVSPAQPTSPLLQIAGLQNIGRMPEMGVLCSLSTFRKGGLL